MTCKSKNVYVGDRFQLTRRFPTLNLFNEDTFVVLGQIRHVYGWRTDAEVKHERTGSRHFVTLLGVDNFKRIAPNAPVV